MKNLTLKTVVLNALIILVGQYAIAQKQDSIKRKKHAYSITLGGGKIIKVEKIDSLAKLDSGTVAEKDCLKKCDKKDNVGFFSGITFTRLDFGFSKLIDNGSFALSPANQFLDFRASKTSHLSFDVLQLGYRFTPKFKMYIAAGFDWTLIRLRQNITMQKNMPVLTYVNDNVSFSKNRFSSSYLHIPLNFEYRTKTDKKGNRFYVVAGPEVAFLLNAKLKQISSERGKQKSYDDYNFSPFRFGGTLRMGYDGIGLFVKYYATDMFDSVQQKGLKNMAFGVTFGLN
ncbi:MAG: PorT family protein [Sphingobacteriales bacterium]|nr:MAG: PorT family protein [Sphingobacteriales bacterium]